MGKRMLLGVGATALCTLALVMALTSQDPAAQATNAWPATKVALATVVQVEAPRQTFAVGELEAARQVQVAAETSGRITRIAFASGQRVKAGQLLVQLNDAPEQAERVRLQAQLRNAQTLLQRVQKLRAGNVATQEQLDNASTALEMAQGALQQVQALIAQKAIRAPFAGKVGIRRVHQGQYLTAGDAVANLVDAGRLHLNFSLNEQAAPALNLGHTAELTVDALPQRRFLAQINAIDPMVGASRTVQVQAVLANPDAQLQAGMFANVRLSAAQPTQVLALPETAITYTAYGQTVFIARHAPDHGLRVKRVQVSTGERWNGQVEITSGLQVGDQVVVSGQLKLSDGMQVEPVAQDTLHSAAGKHAS